MSYHYFIKMHPWVTEESIKFGVINQNLKSIGEFRIEYLGQTEDDEDGITENLLVTGLSKEIHIFKEFEDILSEFISCLEEDGCPKDYDFKGLPALSYSQVDEEELQVFRKLLAGRIDWEWFPEGDVFLNCKESASDRDNLYKKIKMLFYDVQLEYLLDSGLREDYEAYTSSSSSS